MRRVLTTPSVAATPRTVADPRPVLEPLLAAMLDDARAQGRAEGEAAGYARGLAQGAREAQERLDALTRAVVAALAETRDAVRGLRVDQADSVAELALAIAEHVLERPLPPDAAPIVSRVRDWLAAVDDPAVTVAVSPVDAPALTTALADRDDVEVVADARLHPGEARLAGRWATAELVRAARLDEVREVLA